MYENDCQEYTVDDRLVQVIVDEGLFEDVWIL